MAACNSAPAAPVEPVSPPETVAPSPLETAAPEGPVPMQTEAPARETPPVETQSPTPEPSPAEAEPTPAPEIAPAEPEPSAPAPEEEADEAPEPPPTAQPAETAVPPSPAPAPVEAEASGAAALRARTAEFLEGCDGNWSVYYQSVDDGSWFCVSKPGSGEGDLADCVPMVAASLIKLFVYGAVYAQIEAGTLAEADYAASLRSMINISDNDACNRLIDACGGIDAVNQFIESQGFEQTRLNRKMLQPGAENLCSARDCGQVLARALEGSYVSPACSDALLAAMGEQTRRSKLPAGVPAGVETANKTGELANGGAANAENDAAIIFSPAGTYILCVMSGNISNGVAAGQIARLSELVYTALNSHA